MGSRVPGHKYQQIQGPCIVVGLDMEPEITNLYSCMRVCVCVSHLLVQNKVEVVSSVTGRLLRPAAGSSEQPEQRQAERRRTPPTPPEDKFAVGGKSSGQLFRHCRRRRSTKTM